MRLFVADSPTLLSKHFGTRLTRLKSFCSFLLLPCRLQPLLEREAPQLLQASVQLLFNVTGGARWAMSCVALCYSVPLALPPAASMLGAAVCLRLVTVRRAIVLAQGMWAASMSCTCHRSPEGQQIVFQVLRSYQALPLLPCSNQTQTAC